MLCQNCKKNEANIRYTQIINGVRKEVALCNECAIKLGLENIDLPINFNSFLGDFFNDFMEDNLISKSSNTTVMCKNCGTTYDDFINKGMFGCGKCYDVFEAPIDSLLKNLHGTTRHIGRSPKVIRHSINNVDDSKKIAKDIDNKVKSHNEKNNVNVSDNKTSEKDRLQIELDKAIKDERYEDAAKIRDQIKELK